MALLDSNKNSWSVMIDEKPYAVQLNNRKLLINGEKVKLKSYKIS